jgi:GTPase
VSCSGRTVAKRFVSELPTELVAAFRATLEEVAEADVILHIQDTSQPDAAAQRTDVIAVMNSMVKDGMLDEDWPARTIDVLNKVDLLEGVDRSARPRGSIVISARTGEGLETLRAAIDVRLSEGMQTVGYDLTTTEGAELAWLYEHGEVIGRQDSEDAIHVTVRLLPLDRARFERQRTGL